MRKISLLTLFGLLLASSPVFALTTESGNNSNGTPKFTDPDEQRPGYMNGATEDESSPTGQASSGTHFSINGSNGTNGVSGWATSNRSQPDAFDQAYDRK